MLRSGCYGACLVGSRLCRRAPYALIYASTIRELWPCPGHDARETTVGTRYLVPRSLGCPLRLVHCSHPRVQQPGATAGRPSRPHSTQLAERRVTPPHSRLTHAHLALGPISARSRPGGEPSAGAEPEGKPHPPPRTVSRRDPTALRPAGHPSAASRAPRRELRGASSDVDVEREA